MKYLSIIIVVLFFISCQQEPSAQKATQQIRLTDPFNWLEGDWIRLNDPEGRQTFEQWERKSSEVLIGLGYSMQEGDTIFKENLRLVLRDGSWIYEVTGVNESPTNFALIELLPKGFTATHPTNPFPKQIRYSVSQDTLRSIISDDSTRVSFIFTKK